MCKLAEEKSSNRLLINMWHFSARTLFLSACILLYLLSANFDLCHCLPRRIWWGGWRRAPQLPPKSPLRRPPSLRHRIPSPAWSSAVAPARRYRKPPYIRPLPPPTWSTPTLAPPARRRSPIVAPVRRRPPPVHQLSPPPPASPRRPKGDGLRKGSVIKKSIFSVMDYGAKGDGQESDTKAFRSAWEAACKVNASRVVVPEGYEFLVDPIIFLGQRCHPNIVFQVDGTIVAPKSRRDWGHEHGFWIQFRQVTRLTIEGKGTIDGSGSVWWRSTKTNDQLPGDEMDNDIDDDAGEGNDYDVDPTKWFDVSEAKAGRARPTALRLYETNGVTIRDVTIRHSPSCHLSFENCDTVLVHDIRVSSPEDSPNTDGIQLHNSQHVVIRDSNLACGDDCVAISSGSSNVRIHNVNCGPGHGISIGSLGRDHSKACVSDITVRDVYLRNTSNGVRIKSWQGGRGSVRGVIFSNIRVSRVRIPIIIDQYYCDHTKCKNQTSAVEVSDITYRGIRGTFTGVPIHFACSDSVPCTNVSLGGIELKLELDSRHHRHSHGSLCKQTYGRFTSAVTPAMEDCLLAENPFNKRKYYHDSC